VIVGAAFFLGIHAISGFAHPFSQQILHAGVSASERATMLSGWSLSFQLGVVITGLGLAQIAERFHIPRALWIAAASLVLASLLYMAIDRLRLRDERAVVPSSSVQRAQEMIRGN
jgi:sugar phosphate permease